MVAHIGSLTRNGLADFVLQRLSAYLIVLYSFFIVGFLLTEPSYATFSALFGHPLMKWLTLVAVLSIAVHSWIGLWIIGTDYIRPLAFGRWATPLRGLYQLGFALFNFIYIAWIIQILWSL